MNEYIDALRKYVAENPPNYGDGDAYSILEMLFSYYHECNNTDTDAVKAAFEGILRGFFVIFYKIMLKNGFEVSKCPKGRGEIWGNEQF